MAFAGEELFDFVEDLVAVAGPRQVIVTGELDELGVRDLPFKPPTIEMAATARIVRVAFIESPLRAVAPGFSRKRAVVG